MNKKKITSVIFIFIVLVTASIQYKNSLPKKKDIATLTVQIKQIVKTDSDASQIIRRVKVGSTALQILTQTHTVTMTGKNSNAFVMGIDGRNALPERKEFWALYVNGKQALVGAGSYIVKNNDTIEWKIETY